MAKKRKAKRIGKFRGTRSCGTGNTKNKRGKGCKGGWGRAGMHKHRFSYATAHEREWMKHGGRHGFSNPTAKEQLAINLYEIDSLVKKGKIKGKFEFDGKILGTGSLSVPLEISAYAATERAIERIKKAGGKFIQITKKTEAPEKESE